MEVVIESEQPVAGPSRPLWVRPIPFSIDISCPLPTKISNEAPTWPAARDDSVHSFVRQRYLEAVLLPETLSPLSHFALDLLRLEASDASEITQAVDPYILSLQDIEKRHRKCVCPLITAALSMSSKEIRDAKIEEAKSASGLPAEDMELVMAAIALRTGCKAVQEGNEVLNSRKLVEELERRDSTKKKRKRGGKVTGNPKESLDLLFDRVSVWQAVADLRLDGEKGMEKESEVADLIQRFWREVMLSCFMERLPDLVKSFHLKVFGKAFRPESTEVPPTTTKKPRKPKLTRARPSTEDMPAPVKPEPLHRPPSRSLSRAPSEMSHRSLTREESLSMRRSVSHTSEAERPRSRSQSMDASVSEVMSKPAIGPIKRPLARAPSGKDLFKGREVGLMRRTASGVIREKQQETLGVNPAAKTGLLGRKTSDPKKVRNDEPETLAETLVMATPSKPRLANQIFGRRYHPTPIAEEREPSSGGRSWVADTPGGISRITDTPSSRVAETPFGRVRRYSLGEMRQSGAVEDEGEEDTLADLMVMTDEEDDTEPAMAGLVLETPGKVML